METKTYLMACGICPGCIGKGSVEYEKGVPLICLMCLGSGKYEPILMIEEPSQSLADDSSLVHQ